MASIDERVVAMSFENAKFEAAVATTMATLGKLQTSLDNIGKTSGLTNLEADANKVTLSAPMRALDILKGKLGFATAPQAFADLENSSKKVAFEGPSSALDKLKQKLGFPTAPQAFADLQNSSKNVDFKPVSDAIDGINLKFSALQTAATVAFGTVVSKATVAGGQLAKSVTLGPLQQGFEEYGTNLNSIQTILANTKFQGSDLDDVNKALGELNKYSDQTIYNFGEMARNIGTFTAAGVDLDTSVGAIKGIANLAALSGSNSQQASTAMYQLSQAIASGKVGLQDWNSVVNAGMGGATFQRALATTARNMGTIPKEALKIDKATGKATINGESFRESIQAGPGKQSWLTDKVLTSTLKQFTGDMTNAQLAAEGFSDQEIKAVQDTAKTAKQAATEVKTLSGVFDVVKESIGSGWATTFQNIFGNFDEAKSTFTDLTSAITGFVGDNAKARNKVLADWKKLGGRADLIEGIKNIFEGLRSVIKPISDAFRDIFPRKTGKDLADITKRFKEFSENLKLSPETADGLKRTFRGVFAVVHILETVIVDVIKLFGRLFGAAEGGGKGFLGFTGGLGDILVAVDNILTKGGALDAFFKTFEQIIKLPITLVKEFAKVIGNMFSGNDTKKVSGVTDAMGKIEAAAKPLKKIIEDLGGAWKNFADLFDGLIKAIQPVIDFLARQLSNIGKVVADEFDAIDWSDALQALETGLIAGIFLKIKGLFEGNVNLDIGKGAIGKLGKALNGLSTNLQAIQRNIQANTLLQIATAVILLATGITIISSIDGKKLQKSMTAIAVGLGELLAAMAILGAASKSVPVLGLPLIAFSLVLLAGAIVIMAGALRIMATMDWEQIARGLAGVAGALVAVGVGTRVMNPALTLAAAATLIPLAAGILLLAASVKIFASVSWEDLAKGILGVAGALTALVLGLGSLPLNVTVVGPGLLVVALAMIVLAGAVSTFGSMDLETMAKGLIGIAGSLAAMGLAIGLIPPTILVQAAGLVVLAVALTGIAAAMALFGNLSTATIVTGLIAMGGAMLVLAGGLIAMEGTLLGSVALLGAAAAFAVLGPALLVMGKLPFGVIVKGLAVMAATLGVLALVGIFAAGPLTALAGGLALLGGGLIVMATAFYIFTAALSKLGVQGPKSIAALIAAIGAFVLVIPQFFIDFLKGAVEILAAVTKLLPKIVVALGVILDTIIAFVIAQAPKLGQALVTLITEAMTVIRAAAPELIGAGLFVLTSFLAGLSNNIGQITNSVASIVENFLGALAGHAADLAAGGVQVLVSFLAGVAATMGRLVAAAVNIVVQFVLAITNGVGQIVSAAASLMGSFISAVASYVTQVVAAGVRIILDFIAGVGSAGPRIVRAAVTTAGKFMDTLAKELVRLVDLGFQAMIDFLNGLATAIRERGPELRAAGYNVADAILDGIVQGFSELGGKVTEAVGDVIGALPKAARKILGIKSPSTVFRAIGGYMMQGLTEGITPRESVRAMATTAKAVVDAAQKGFGKIPFALGDVVDVDPVITPVLDLSNVQQEAKKLDDISNVIPITAAASFDSANAISQEQQAAQAVQAAEAAQAQVPNLHFEQNNYSPESLSNVEIYRQTSNQLSLAKSAVGLP